MYGDNLEKQTTIYILVKAEVSMQGVEPDINLVCGGSKADCKLKMEEIAEEELLGFDLDDPDTWVIEDTGAGNDGECYTLYQILPVQVSCGAPGETCKPDEDRLKKLEYENERIREQNMKFATDSDKWETKYKKLENSVATMFCEAAKLFGLVERKAKRNAQEEI